VQAGLAYMTKDRKGKGLLLNMGLRPNLTLLTLEKHMRAGFLDTSSEDRALERAVRRFDIRARDASVAVGRLSGGNQQKLMLGKTMESEPDIIIMDEPTRGIDVGTKQQIYHIIAALAAEGNAVIVISSELQEVIGLRPRVAPVAVGRLSGGNQQKLQLGKPMESEPDILIMDEPTRGIDVGTKQQIYLISAALAAEGKAVVVISSERQEVIGLSHRVVV